MKEDKVELGTVIRLLTERDIKPSMQRIKILHHLANREDHPTAEEIYLGLHREVPTLSKTTVYHNLDLFVEHQLAQKVFIEKSQARYEVEPEIHGHFHCTTCKSVYNVPVNSADEEIDGHQIVKQEVYYKGVCKDCLKK